MTQFSNVDEVLVDVDRNRNTHYFHMFDRVDVLDNTYKRDKHTYFLHSDESDEITLKQAKRFSHEQIMCLLLYLTSFHCQVISNLSNVKCLERGSQ